MQALLEALENAPPGRDDYSAYLEAAIGDLGNVTNPSELFAHVFRFFESHAEADLGTPGPLVHLLERFYPQYVDEMCASISKRPTTYTIWMVNRILNNQPTETMRQRLIEVLEGVASSTAASIAVQEQAKLFLDRHEKSAR
jgi:hypothetical protein